MGKIQGQGEGGGQSVRSEMKMSVSDKTGLAEFAKALTERGVEILSTGGTYKYLQEHGVGAREVSQVATPQG